MAISADGYITKHEDGIVDWTSKEDKGLFSSLTREAGVVIFGSKTYQTLPEPLEDRLNIVMSKTESKGEEGKLEFTDLKPSDLIDSLAERGFSLVVLGGGSKINSSFLKEGLIDELYLSVEPVIFGSGKRIFTENELDIKLELLATKKLGQDGVLLHYRFIK